MPRYMRVCLPNFMNIDEILSEVAGMKNCRDRTGFLSVSMPKNNKLITNVALYLQISCRLDTHKCLKNSVNNRNHSSYQLLTNQSGGTYVISDRNSVRGDPSRMHNFDRISRGDSGRIFFSTRNAIVIFPQFRLKSISIDRT